jgi:hypothetical protein
MSQILKKIKENISIIGIIIWILILIFLVAFPLATAINYKNNPIWVNYIGITGGCIDFGIAFLMFVFYASNRKYKNKTIK